MYEFVLVEILYLYALANELGDKLAMIVSACDNPCGNNHGQSARIYGVDAELLDDNTVRIIEINRSFKLK